MMLLIVLFNNIILNNVKFLKIIVLMLLSKLKLRYLEYK